VGGRREGDGAELTPIPGGAAPSRGIDQVLEIGALRHQHLERLGVAFEISRFDRRLRSVLRPLLKRCRGKARCVAFGGQ